MLQKGQKVISMMGEMGRTFDGSYVEYVLLPNAQIYPIDTHLDWVQLSAVPETYYTAFGSMQQLRIEPTDRVFTLDQVPDAHRFLQSAVGFGKVVVINAD